MTPTLLSGSSAYQNWQAATHSALLLLSGSTAPDGRNSRGLTHSWLSSATTYVVEEVRERGELVAYYSCHPGLRAEPHEGRDIIAGLVYQMLERKPEVLRRKEQQFRTMVRSEAWRNHEGESVTVEITFQLLREVLFELKELGTIYIVVDRIDLASWKFHRIMSAFVELVQDESSAHVKIMATAARYWDDEGVEESARQRVMTQQGWDQRLLSPMEIRRARSATPLR